jgi:hypothetical protein
VCDIDVFTENFYKDVSMKYVKYVEPIQIKFPDRTESFTFSRFINDLVLTDKKIGANFQTISAGQRIQAVSNKSLDGYYVFESSDWNILKEIVELPSNGYNPVVAINLIPFMKAILEATDSIE